MARSADVEADSVETSDHVCAVWLTRDQAHYTELSNGADVQGNIMGATRFCDTALLPDDVVYRFVRYTKSGMTLMCT